MLTEQYTLRIEKNASIVSYKELHGVGDLSNRQSGVLYTWLLQQIPVVHMLYYPHDITQNGMASKQLQKLYCEIQPQLRP
jgi:hypothetical protein